MKGLINLKNEDNECFRCCHIRHLNPGTNNPQRIINPTGSTLRTWITLASSSQSVAKTTRRSKGKTRSTNVFSYEEEFYPICISKEKYVDDINLLLITEETEESGAETIESHYVLIKDFNKVMYNKPNHKERKHSCFYSVTQRP